MMEKHSFFAYTKQQVDQNKRKIVANFIKPLFIQKTNIFKSQKNHNFSSKATEYNNLELLRKAIKPINNELCFELFRSLINIKKLLFFKKARQITIRIVFRLS